MSATVIVEASAVRVGDRIYDARSAAWLTVRDVAYESGRWIVIKTAAYSKWMRPRETIAIQRTNAEAV